MYHFDNKQREFIVHRYNTPTPWMNYLSNGTFHTMMSQAGGGVAFYKSPQIWRINHYKFFHVPTDRSGFYTYILDGDDCWCPTNEPCKSKPEKWSAAHGMGYTRFEARKNGLSATATYTVGPYENALIWNLKLTSDVDKKITVVPYVELGMMEFMRELQWQCYNKHQLSCYHIDDVLVYRYGVEMQPKPNETPLVYFAADVPVTAFDCDRDEFVGSYRSEENPQNIENRRLTNSTLYGGDPCFALQLDIELKAGEEKEINVKFPEEYFSKELAGKDAVFKVTVHEIKEKELPTLDDEFAKDVSEFETLNELKADLKAKKEEQNENRSKVELEEKAIEDVCEASEVEIPEGMVELELDHMVEDMDTRMQYQGIKFEQYLQMVGKTMAEFRNESKETAEKTIKTRLVLEAIAKDAKIEATEEELKEKIAELAKTYARDEEELNKNEHLKGHLKENIIAEKTIKLIVDSAKVKKVEKEEECSCGHNH